MRYKLNFQNIQHVFHLFYVFPIVIVFHYLFLPKDVSRNLSRDRYDSPEILSSRDLRDFE